MIEIIKNFINQIAAPQVSFTFLVLIFFFIFPPSEKLYRFNKKIGLDRLWSNTGGKIIMGLLFVFFVFGFSDPNFRLIIAKPDNVPIVGLLFLVVFFLWFSLKQARDNDMRIAKGKGPNEAEDAREKVLVWPDLVYIELIAMIGITILLLVWAMCLSAPLEAPANPTVSPNPSKAPWYFLGLQEMLVYFDPWIAGVLFPGVIMFGFMAIPFIDNNPKGSGYYTYNDRKMAISIFLFLWLVLWIFLISTGTFLRGPNWNFFGPFEYWDSHKLVALTNVNLSEVFYMMWQNKSLPSNILLRELPGFFVIGFYFLVIPFLLTKTILKGVAQKLGILRFNVFMLLLLLTCSLPIKMYLRWFFNIKYLVAIPEIFLNI